LLSKAGKALKYIEISFWILGFNATEAFRHHQTPLVLKIWIDMADMEHDFSLGPFMGQ
jgi:hypothetical protein